MSAKMLQVTTLKLNTDQTAIILLTIYHSYQQQELNNLDISLHRCNHSQNTTCKQNQPNNRNGSLPEEYSNSISYITRSQHDDFNDIIQTLTVVTEIAATPLLTIVTCVNADVCYISNFFTHRNQVTERNYNPTSNS